MDEETAPAPVTSAGDTTNQILSWAAIAIAALSIAELVGTSTIGLAVNVKSMNFPIRQGYAFLTILEKTPVGLALIVAAVFAAIATGRRVVGESPRITNAALWIVVASGAILAVATVLAVMARFRVAELRPDQAIDSITRRVLVVFVIRNFGAAIIAVLLALNTLFRPKTRLAAPAPAVD